MTWHTAAASHRIALPAVPMLLAAYGATRGDADALLLAVLHGIARLAADDAAAAPGFKGGCLADAG